MRGDALTPAHAPPPPPDGPATLLYPSLEALFTLPFALHLEPPPTLTYRIDRRPRRATAPRMPSPAAAHARAQAQAPAPHRRLQSFRPRSRPARGPGIEPSDHYGSVFSSGSDDDDDGDVDVGHAGAHPSSTRARAPSHSAGSAAPRHERLVPVWADHPPHGPDTISLLLQHTDAYSAIHALARAIRLLDRASRSRGPSAAAPLDAMDPADAPQPHDASFAALRAFFDTRFDAGGNLVAPRAQAAEVPGTSTTADSTPRMRYRATDPAPHRSGTPSGGGAVHGVHVAAPNGSGSKLVRFPIRLDLHSVGLAPTPAAVRAAAARHRAGRDARSPPNVVERSRTLSRGLLSTPTVMSDSIPENAVCSPPQTELRTTRSPLPPLATTNLPPADPAALTLSPADMAAGLATPWALPPAAGSGPRAKSVSREMRDREDESSPGPASGSGSGRPMRRQSSFTTVDSGASAGPAAANMGQGGGSHTNIVPPPGLSNRDKDRRPSFFQRVLDIGFRHKTRSSSFATGHLPPHEAASRRRGSVPAQVHEDHTGHLTPGGLDTPWEKPTHSYDSAINEVGNPDIWSDVVAESEEAGASVFSDGTAPESGLFAEGDDILTLLRQAATAAHTLLGPTSKGDNSPQTPRTSLEDEGGEVARDLLSKLASDRWLEGPLDPNPVVVAGALGLALGWEGIMDLCYGPGSRADFVGDFIALGRAAAIHRAVEEDQAKIIAWASTLPPSPPFEATWAPAPDILPDPLPPEDTEWDSLSIDELYRDLDRLDPETRKAPRKDSAGSASAGAGDEEGPRGWLKKIRDRVQTGRDETASNASSSQYSGPDGGQHGLTQALLAAHDAAEAQAQAEADGPVHPTRTWQDWMALFRSLAGWVAEYEQVRIQAGLALELLPSKEDLTPSAELPLSGSHTPSTLSVGGRTGPCIPTAAATAPVELDTNAYLPMGLLDDLAGPHHAFRRRPGMPDASIWGRGQLSAKHISTPLSASLFLNLIDA